MPTEQRTEVQRARTARRPGANAGHTLRMRRTWYADTPTDPKPDEQTNDKSADKLDPLDAWIKTLPPEQQAGATALATELRATRAEAKDRRLKLDDFEKQRLGAEQKQRDEEAERLKKQGEWEKLAQQREQEKAALEPYKAQAEQYAAALKALVEKRLADTPDHLKPLVERLNPIEALEWLEANAAVLKPPPAPDTDAGKRGDKGKPAPDKQSILAGRRARY